MPDPGHGHAGEVNGLARRYLVEPAKLERELGWRPLADFATALAETIDWYVESEAWWPDALRRKGDLQVAWAGTR